MFTSPFSKPLKGIMDDIFGLSIIGSVEVITAPPVKVSGISPVDDATNRQLDIIITWARSDMAQWYDVYFGEVDPPVTKVSNDQTARAYVPTLALGKTYYFRIDSGNSFGETTGDVMSFSTWSSEDILLDGDGNPVTDQNGVYIETP